MKKTSRLPGIRVAPALRRQAQRLLRDGESLSSFMLEAVKARIRDRELEGQFVERGLSSRDQARRMGAYSSSASVVSGLRRRLHRAKRKSAKG